MQIVWLIVGRTGEYDDCLQWNVVAYTYKEAAEIHVKKLNELTAKPYFNSLESLSKIEDKIRTSQLDSKCRIDYTGTVYSIQEIQLRDKYQ